MLTGLFSPYGDAPAHAKALVRRQFEDLINRKDLSVLDTDLAVDFRDHGAAPGSLPGIEGAKAWIRHLHAAIPDLLVTIDAMVAEGDLVVVRNTWRGTHTGLFLGLPATGRPFTLTGMVMWRIRNGLIQERWASLDRLETLRQLQAAS